MKTSFSIKIEGETGLMLNSLLNNVSVDYHVSRSVAKIALQQALRSEQVSMVLADEVVNILLRNDGIKYHG